MSLFNSEPEQDIIIAGSGPHARAGQHPVHGVRALQGGAQGGQDHPVRQVRPRVPPVLPAARPGARAGGGLGLPALHRRRGGLLRFGYIALEKTCLFACQSMLIIFTARKGWILRGSRWKGGQGIDGVPCSVG